MFFFRTPSKKRFWNVRRRNFVLISLSFSKDEPRLSAKVRFPSLFFPPPFMAKLTFLVLSAAAKDELVDMIQHGAEKIINSTESMEVDDDIELIISRGEARTQELNSKYAQLNFDDLQIFKSETTTNWEGENYGGKKKIGLTWIEPSKRERKSNYSVDGYYRDAMRTGGPAARTAGTKAPRAPKQVSA